MAYISGIDRNQVQLITTSLDALIAEDNCVRVIDAYVNSSDLSELEFIEYSGVNRGQSRYRRTDLLKLHIYGYLNKIRSSRTLEIEAKRNLELMWLVSAITTNDINDQNQLYNMAKQATDLLEISSPTVVANTGYYNGTEIKNCIDDGMTVYIKKAKANNKTKNNEI